ncbi:hypothetical protein GJ744_012120 [Endocarpon pusillum]|uniref:Uncharacterized protein n=1 Tax=Endocarpon pusillum TaxID=364733 RepID=A0A8H7ACA6_9EURO|nr:hypothetical protein GJ744_012120 [Endocarpon pusillum]
MGGEAADGVFQKQLGCQIRINVQDVNKDEDGKMVSALWKAVFGVIQIGPCPGSRTDRSRDWLVFGRCIGWER